MAKDPAFLFYPNDYIGGTMGMTFEEKGAYIELLMAQFNRGHMSGHMCGQIVGQKLWEVLKFKFEIDSNGLYFNERLDTEKTKRQEFTSSRRNNLSGKNQHSKGGHKDGHMTSHMENRNEDINNLNKGSQVETFFSDLPNSTALENTAKQLNVSKEELLSYLNQFRKTCKPIYESFGDFVSHFKNSYAKWLKTQNTQKLTKRNQLL